MKQKCIDEFVQQGFACLQEIIDDDNLNNGIDLLNMARFICEKYSDKDIREAAALRRAYACFVLDSCSKRVAKHAVEIETRLPAGVDITEGLLADQRFGAIAENTLVYLDTIEKTLAGEASLLPSNVIDDVKRDILGYKERIEKYCRLIECCTGQN